MFTGIGTDIIEIKRIKKAIANERFLNRVYTKKEIEIINNIPERAAGRFAAKEALVKAFGMGFYKISPIEIEVLNDSLGKPYFILYGNAKRFAEENKIYQIKVSISHCRKYAIAFVTI